MEALREQCFGCRAAKQCREDVDAFLQSANKAAEAAVQARKPQPKKARPVRCCTPLITPINHRQCSAPGHTSPQRHRSWDP